MVRKPVKISVCLKRTPTKGGVKLHYKSTKRLNKGKTSGNCRGGADKSHPRQGVQTKEVRKHVG